MTRTLRILNLTAQSRRPFEKTVCWFQNLLPDEQPAVLRELAMAISQAHPTSHEVAEAVGRPGLKPTYTSCVLFIRHGSPGALHRLIALPIAEREKAFRLMLHVLSAADTRRRTSECAGGCTHEWHHLDDIG